MKRPMHKIIEEQIRRWEQGKIQAVPVAEQVNVITISREAGSRGREVAEKLARNTGFDLFHNEILETMPDVIAMVHHRGDAMELDDPEMVTTYAPFYPSGWVDRYLFDDQSEVGFTRTIWVEKIEERASHIIPAAFNMTKNYNAETRELKVWLQTSVCSISLLWVSLSCGVMTPADMTTFKASSTLMSTGMTSSFLNRTNIPLVGLGVVGTYMFNISSAPAGAANLWLVSDVTKPSVYMPFRGYSRSTTFWKLLALFPKNA